MWYYIAATGVREEVKGVKEVKGGGIHQDGALRRFAHLAIRVFSGDI
jgi:hypothetical protein